MAGIAKHDLKTLRRSIPRGGLYEVLARLNKQLAQEGKDQVSYSMVAAVMGGYAYRQDIIDVAIAYAEELKLQNLRQVASNGEKIKKATA